jgi:hypothetical protein
MTYDSDTADDMDSTHANTEYPPAFDLRKDVSKPMPKVIPGTIDPTSMTGTAPPVQAGAVLSEFNEALTSKSIERLANCFFPGQAYWRDMVALTSHLRTFTEPHCIAAALTHLVSLRGLRGSIKLAGDAKFAMLSPVMVSRHP